MYEQYYGFRERPFDLTPNPRYLFLTPKHQEALSTLRYGLSSRKGITLLIGEAGTGKTTLLSVVLDSIRPPIDRCVYINNPTLTRGEFFEFLASGFGLVGEAVGSKARFLLELTRGIHERHRLGGLTAIVIDEAQSLPDVLLEEVRLLANIETEVEKLLPVLLVGQPELARRLDEPGLQQVKQRVALRCQIGPLSLPETAGYIAGRIRIAGGDVSQVFTRDAVVAIFERSHGIPRTISVICDNALVTGFAIDAKPITRKVVLEVCSDLSLLAEDTGAEPSGRHVLSLKGPPARQLADLARPAPAPRPARQPTQAAREPSQAPERPPEPPSAAPSGTGQADGSASPDEQPAMFGGLPRRRRFLFF